MSAPGAGAMCEPRDGRDPRAHTPLAASRINDSGSSTPVVREAASGGALEESSSDDGLFHAHALVDRVVRRAVRSAAAVEQVLDAVARQQRVVAVLTEEAIRAGPAD